MGAAATGEPHGGGVSWDPTDDDEGNGMRLLASFRSDRRLAENSKVRRLWRSGGEEAEEKKKKK